MSVPPSISREIANLVAPYLDSKSLAIASCVSKPWNLVMSSNSVWSRIFAADYPLLSASLEVVDIDPLVPVCRLYGMCYTSANKRSKLIPSKPHLSLKDLVFVISVAFEKLSIDVVKSCDEIMRDPDAKFLFEIDVDGRGDLPFELGVVENVRVTCNLVLKGCKAMFSMINLEGKMGFSPSLSKFLEMLPCWFSGDSGILAELKLIYSVRSDGRIGVDKLVIGMRIKSGRYISVDEGLRYLQQFLRP